MTYTHIDQVPRRSQWEDNSKPNQSGNCGPTSVSLVADFYRDAVFGIEATRDLVPNTDGGGTSYIQQRDMLAKRGVPCAAGQPTAAQLTDLVSSGRRPVVIGMLMSSVPAAIRGHSFGGVHAVAVRRNAVVNGVPGKLIMDPNFGYGHTVDVTNGARFYPDTVVEAARIGANRRAIIPNAPKVVGSPMPYIEAIPEGYPAGTALSLEPNKAYSGWTYDPVTGAKRPFSVTLTRASGVNTTARIKFAGEAEAYYVPRIYVPPSGYKDDAYLLAAGITPPVVEDPDATKQAAHDAAADVAAVAADVAAKYPAP